jgi:hypothetical protein
MNESPERYRASFKFWSSHWTVAANERSKVIGATPAASEAFDLELAFDGEGSLAQAGETVLHSAATLVGLGPSPGRAVDLAAKSPLSWEALEINDPLLDLRRLPAGSPVSLWRAHDGWILVSTSSPGAWRDFCATFLSLGLSRRIPAGEAWSNFEVNDLATKVLDTHKAADAVATCLAYGVPATLVEHWSDVRAGNLSKALSERLAWAALGQL